MNTRIAVLLCTPFLATGVAAQGTNQETNQPKLGSRRLVDVSLEGLDEAPRRTPVEPGGPLGLTARRPTPSPTPFDCLESIADQATGMCLTASSTPTLGLLYPYPGLNNSFVPQAFVGGGEDNQAIGPWSTVAGGRNNTATGYSRFGSLMGYATVGGGYANSASGVGATVGGGGGKGFFTGGNTASGDFSTVAGGIMNVSSGYYATVGGGDLNYATGNHATIGGGNNNKASAPTTVVSGGASNSAEATFATVGGGSGNRAVGYNATVCGGAGNNAYGDATVGGGFNNAAIDLGATIGGGAMNTALSFGTIGGGFVNFAENNATVGGGANNSASGRYATVPGGERNAASGDFSFAAGRFAKASHDGAFVWGDSQGSFANTRPSSAPDEFTVYCSGGARFFTDSAATTGVLLAPGGSTWTMVSDRDAKENVEPVDARAVLDKVASLPVATWNYKAQNDSIRHMGPMAQDFYAAFGLGLGDKTIDTIDPNGVALAAIQGLNAIVEEKDGEIEALRAANEDLRSRVERLEALAWASLTR